MALDDKIAKVRQRLSPDVRQKQLIRAAHDILMKEGYSALSFSRIAKVCGIRLSTAQHHFPDRSMLIDAVLKLLFDDLLGRYEALDTDAIAGPASQVEAMVRLLTADVDNADIASLFFELWAFSHRDPVIARAIEQLYARVRTHLADLIAATDPAISTDEALRRAIMVMAMADGLTVTMSHGSSPLNQPGDVEREAVVARLVRLALEG